MSRVVETQAELRQELNVVRRQVAEVRSEACSSKRTWTSIWTERLAENTTEKSQTRPEHRRGLLRLVTNSFTNKKTELLSVTVSFTFSIFRHSRECLKIERSLPNHQIVGFLSSLYPKMNHPTRKPTSSHKNQFWNFSMKIFFFGQF